MHLEGPWLTTTGKRKGKKKYRNSEEARKARELEENWLELQKKWGIQAENKKTSRAMKAKQYVPPKVFNRTSELPKVPSLPFTAGPCTKSEQKIYTGTKVKGIGTMHKSNAVPIFSDEEAIDISKMRR